MAISEKSRETCTFSACSQRRAPRDSSQHLAPRLETNRTCIERHRVIVKSSSSAPPLISPAACSGRVFRAASSHLITGRRDGPHRAGLIARHPGQNHGRMEDLALFNKRRSGPAGRRRHGTHEAKSRRRPDRDGQRPVALRRGRNNNPAPLFARRCCRTEHGTEGRSNRWTRRKFTPPER